MTDRTELFSITLSAEEDDLVATVSYKQPVLPLTKDLEETINKHITAMVQEIHDKELLG